MLWRHFFHPRFRVLLLCRWPCTPPAQFLKGREAGSVHVHRERDPRSRFAVRCGGPLRDGDATQRGEPHRNCCQAPRRQGHQQGENKPNARIRSHLVTRLALLSFRQVGGSYWLLSSSVFFSSFPLPDFCRLAPCHLPCLRFPPAIECLLAHRPNPTLRTLKLDKITPRHAVSPLG